MNSGTPVIVISTADILPGRFYFCSNLIICGDKEYYCGAVSNPIINTLIIIIIIVHIDCLC